MGTKISELNSQNIPNSDMQYAAAASGDNFKISQSGVEQGFLAHVEQISNISISLGTSTDELNIPLGPWRDSVTTISKVRYFTYPSGEALFNIEERPAENPTGVGVGIFASNVTASGTPTDVTSMSNSSISANANLHLVVPESGFTGASDLVISVYGLKS